MFARCGRWQPKQLGFQELWQAMQLISVLMGPLASLRPGYRVPRRPRRGGPRRRTRPSWPCASGRCNGRWWDRWYRPSARLPRRDRARPPNSGRSGPGRARSVVRIAACRRAFAGPRGCALRARSGRAAGDQRRALRWLSRGSRSQVISMAARTSPWSLVLPWMSWAKWQSAQCMPFSRWTSSRCTGTPFARRLPVCRSVDRWRGVMAAISFSVLTSRNDVALVVEHVAVRGPS